MTTFSGALNTQDAYLTRDNARLSDDIDTLVVDFWPPYGGDILQYETRPLETGVLTDNLPISIATHSINVKNTNGYVNDWYNTIHITPNNLAAGAILTEKSMSFYVWNAFFTTQTLSSLAVTGLTNITITPGITTPDSYKSLQEKAYTLVIDNQGAPILDGNYSFVFNDVSYLLTITGYRLILWPFPPLLPFNETREWNTEVLETITAEERHSYRDVPKETLSYKYRFDTAEQFSFAKTLANAATGAGLATPYWLDATQISSISAGVSEIYFPTANLEISVGGLLAIWKKWDQYETVEIDTIYADRVLLKSPTELSYITPWIIPVKEAKSLTGVNITRHAASVVDASIVFTTTNTFYSATWFDVDTFLGYPILYAKTMMTESLDERISQNIEVFDTGTNDFTVLQNSEYMRYDQMVGFAVKTREERYNLRRALDYLKGKYNLFWLPSFSDDLVPANAGQTLISGATAVTVKYVGWSKYGYKNIQVIGTTGTINLAVSSVVASSDNEIVNFSGPTAYGIGEIKHIYALYKVRLASDRVEFSNEARNLTFCSIPVTEVP